MHAYAHHHPSKGADGGLWRGDEEKRPTNLSAKRSSPGSITSTSKRDVAELYPPASARPSGIVSYHNFKSTPADLGAISPSSAHGTRTPISSRSPRRSIRSKTRQRRPEPSSSVTRRFRRSPSPWAPLGVRSRASWAPNTRAPVHSTPDSIADLELRPRHALVAWRPEATTTCLRLHRRRDRGLRRRRRPDRPQPQPGDPQRGVPDVGIEQDVWSPSSFPRVGL